MQSYHKSIVYELFVQALRIANQFRRNDISIKLLFSCDCLLLFLLLKLISVSYHMYRPISIALPGIFNRSRFSSQSELIYSGGSDRAPLYAQYRGGSPLFLAGRVELGCQHAIATGK